MTATLTNPDRIIDEVFAGLDYRDRTERAKTVLSRAVHQLVAQQRPSHPYQRARRAATTTAQAGLSATQLRVLHGMSHGMTNGDIGRALGLSEDTVKTHARKVFLKLGVRNRSSAVAAGFRRGLLRVGDRAS